MSRNLRDPYESPKNHEHSLREERSRESFAMISPVMAMLAFLCLAYVWLQVNYPPVGRRYYGHELIYFVIGSWVFVFLGLGAAMMAKNRTVGLICNILMLAWNVAVFFLGVVP